MYLLTLKSLGKIFLFLSIINIPAMYVFYSGTEADNREEIGLINKIFLKFSLGNLGDQGLSCNTANLAKGFGKISL